MAQFIGSSHILSFAQRHEFGPADAVGCPLLDKEAEEEDVVFAAAWQSAVSVPTAQKYGSSHSLSLAYRHEFDPFCPWPLDEDDGVDWLDCVF